MDRFSFVTVLLSSLLLTACVGLSVDSADLSAFKHAHVQSYAWATPAMELEEGLSARVSLFDHALRQSVNKRLADKSYRLVEKDQAEFIIDYRFFRSMNVNQSGAGGANLDGAWDATMPTASGSSVHGDYMPTTIKENNLRIAFIDAKTNDELWHVRAKKVKEETVNDPNEINDRVEDLVSELFSDLPRYQ